MCVGVGVGVSVGGWVDAYVCCMLYNIFMCVIADSRQLARCKKRHCGGPFAATNATTKQFYHRITQEKDDQTFCFMQKRQMVHNASKQILQQNTIPDANPMKRPQIFCIYIGFRIIPYLSSLFAAASTLFPLALRA